MSIATQISALQTDKTNIASAITTKGGTVNSGDGFDNFASDILTIPTGGGGQTQTKSLSVTSNGSYTVLPDTGYTLDEVDVSVSVVGKPLEPKDITFYDWDGAVLYTYTFDEIQNLSELPPLPPTYKDYTANSWTETLSFLQGLTVPFNVGVNYTTTRTSTKFYITVDNLRKEVNVFNPSQSNSNWNVDWGDGTTTTVNRSSKGTHSYATAGDYVVAVTPTSSSGKVVLRAQMNNNTFLYGGTIYSSFDFQGITTEATAEKKYHNTILRGIEPGHGSGKFVISDYGLMGTSYVKSMVLPMGTVIDRWGYRYSGFEFVSFPSDALVGSSSYRFGFQDMRKLKRVVLPSSKETASSMVPWTQYTSSGVAQYLFKNCQSLVEYLPTSISSASGFNTADSTFAGEIVSDLSVYEEKITVPASFNLERLNVPENITTMNNVLGTISEYNSETGWWIAWNIYMPLRHLHLPSTLTSLTNEDFSCCNELDEIRFPAALITLADVNLPKVSYFESTVPPFISNVTGTIARVIYVPAESVNDYQTAWPDFASIIQAAPTT